MIIRNEKQSSTSDMHRHERYRKFTNLLTSGLWRQTLDRNGHVDGAPSPHFEPRERQLRLKCGEVCVPALDLMSRSIQKKREAR
jgi:hypothetical protein